MEAVGVLELVHHQVVEALLPLKPDCFVLFEKLHGEQKQVVEVDGVKRFEFGLVTGENCADEAFFVARGRFTPAVIFGFGNEVLRQIRLQLFIFGSRAGDDFFDEPDLVAFIVNGKVVLVAQLFDA